MSDVQQRSQHRRSIGGLVLEFAMIGIGVFLGASAEQWRETRHHRELATASLRNFRRELADNRAYVVRVHEYHVALGTNVRKLLNSKGPLTLDSFFQSLHWRGLAPVEFKHTAWDLALATQALSDIDPRLAFAVSDVYTVQQTFDGMQNTFSQSAFAPSTFANSHDVSGLAWAMGGYLEDVNIQEPRLLKLYDNVLPQIDAALGGPVPAATKTPQPTSDPKPGARD